MTQRYNENETDFGADGGYIPDPLYLTPLTYQQPRYVRLGLDVVYGGHNAPPVEAAAPLPPPPPPPPPATQTCPDGSVIDATATCPPPPPPPAPTERGERGQ